MDTAPKHFFNSRQLWQDLSKSRSLGDSFGLWSASGGGLGYFRYAPGTWGSLPGLALGLGFFQVYSSLASPWSFTVLAALIMGGLAWAFFTIKSTERLLGIHDEPRIVVDEIIGQAIAICLVEPSAQSLLIGFLLFRLLDILKPGPIGYLDREIPGAWGTLLDDVLAGGLTAGSLICLQFWGVL